MRDRADRTVVKWLCAIVLVLGCAKKQERDPVGEPVVPALSADEVQTSRDACKGYVARVCACAETVPAVKPTCDLARALPDAVRISLEVAASPDSSKHDVISAQHSVRKTVKECIEQTAKLPALGCP